MTKGKVVNKQTGLEITGFLTNQLDRYFWFTIDGDDDNIRSFDNNSWDFIEDKPSAYEQYVALKPGTRFVLDAQTEYTRIKLDDTHYGYEYVPGRWDVIGNDTTLEYVFRGSELTVLDNES
jgi:hypothetical protein